MVIVSFENLGFNLIFSIIDGDIFFYLRLLFEMLFLLNLMICILVIVFFY